MIFNNNAGRGIQSRGRCGRSLRGRAAENIFTLSLIILILSLSSCTAIGKWADRSGLESMADQITEDFDPGTPGELEAFLSKIDIEEATRAAEEEVEVARRAVRGAPPEKWLLEEKLGSDLRQRRYLFTGAFEELISEETLETDSPARKAVFYRYELEERPSKGTVLFLPGLGVSDFAFRFISRLFLSILEEGWDLLVYVPPFHLERAGEGEDVQYKLFTDDIEANIRYQLAMVREVRTMIKVLEEEDAGPLGAWGGSMGAATLLLASLWEEMDHAAVMIPIVDWNIVLTGDICMEKCVPAFREAGFEDELINRAYSLISPAEYPLGLEPERVLVQAAEADQLTPPGAVEEYAEDRGIDKVQRYSGSHATILLYPGVYKDYREFLSSLSH
ncbi:MAG: hypothetical protein R6V67_00905 [Spirochaetia bacterium]